MRDPYGGIFGALIAIILLFWVLPYLWPLIIALVIIIVVVALYFRHKVNKAIHDNEDSSYTYINDNSARRVNDEDIIDAEYEEKEVNSDDRQSPGA